MTVPYAEVIGDPIAHSKSPLIHTFWLEKLGLEGDYRARRVTADGLLDYLIARLDDPNWRGCNVTAPLKEPAATLAKNPNPTCDFMGAVNCVTPVQGIRCQGSNTDIEGVAEALAGIELRGARVCVIGAGGAAEAMLCYLCRQQVAHVSMLVRDTRKGARLAGRLPRNGIASVAVEGFERALAATCGTRLIVNATPMGMLEAAPMDQNVLNGLGIDAGEGVTAFDMVYSPTETPFLAAARSLGATTVNGLPMLIGQAAPAFRQFFGLEAPREHDAELREILLQ